ncbi:unnamed protein product, partial [Iphiclides podalirius]
MVWAYGLGAMYSYTKPEGSGQQPGGGIVSAKYRRSCHEWDRLAIPRGGQRRESSVCKRAPPRADCPPAPRRPRARTAPRRSIASRDVKNLSSRAEGGPEKNRAWGTLIVCIAHELRGTFGQELDLRAVCSGQTNGGRAGPACLPAGALLPRSVALYASLASCSTYLHKFMSKLRRPGPAPLIKHRTELIPSLKGNRRTLHTTRSSMGAVGN